MKLFALAAVTAVVLSGAAQASVIPVLSSVTPDGSNFLYSYTGELATDQGVTNGSKLVIIDFAGYVAGSVHSPYSTVTASVQNTLPAGMLLDPGFSDNASIPDLVFTYTGPDYRTSGGPYPTLTDFSGLTAESTFRNITMGSFSALAVKNDGNEAGTPAYNVGQISVPLGPVPEPSSWALMLAGFFGLGMVLRRRKSSGAYA
jgi:hypothetical protein